MSRRSTALCRPHLTDVPSRTAAQLRLLGQRENGRALRCSRPAGRRYADHLRHRQHLQPQLPPGLPAQGESKRHRAAACRITARFMIGWCDGQYTARQWNCSLQAQESLERDH